MICRFFQTAKSNDLQPLFRSLDDCIANFKWLLTLYDERIIASLPPFTACNPMFLVIWHCIPAVQMESRLLGDGACSYAQIAAADALCTLSLTNEPVILEKIMTHIVHLLKNAPIEVQIQAVELVTEMAEVYDATKYDSVDGNVIFPLVTILSSKTVIDESEVNLPKPKLERRYVEALWMVAARSKTNCRTTRKTKTTVGLPKLVGTEWGRLRYYCLMIIMEITAFAESDINFLCTVFKTNALSTKAAVDQLLRVTKESNNHIVQIPAIRSISSLARIFQSGETQIIFSLVPVT
ncbi:uncharacterized protein LOC120175330 [Hibiscus syriacus]|uniref:uncharacterized protein LOC120175330 n=1 Tax=Hibiscus syriacus TaxID=106335 RepID=UPI001920DA12|nr:uncharacterized protein LOC120175330 [Hibiscus syriacus]